MMAWYTAFNASSIELFRLHACFTPSVLRSTLPSLFTNGRLTRVRNRRSGGCSGYDGPHSMANSNTRMSNVVPAGPKIVPVQCVMSSSSSASRVARVHRQSSALASSVVGRSSSRCFHPRIRVSRRVSSPLASRRLRARPPRPRRPRVERIIARLFKRVSSPRARTRIRQTVREVRR